MKYLWVPTDEASAISSPSSRTTTLSGSITTSSSGFDQVGPGTPGWEGMASTSAGARAVAFKGLLSTFSSTMAQGATAMKAWSTKFASYKETFASLDNQYADAKSTYDTATAKLNPADGSEPDLLTTIVYGAAQTVASAEMDRIRGEHTTTKTQYDTDQTSAATAIRALIPPEAPTSPAGAMSFATTQVGVVFERADADAGQTLAEQIREDLQDDMEISDENLALLQDEAENADFVTALYEELGPQGIAALSWSAQRDLSPAAGDEDRGQALFEALSTTLTVAANNGVIDGDWLDDFNPDGFFDNFDMTEYRRYDEDGDEIPVSAMSLLIPLMQTNADGTSKLPSDVLGEIGTRAFDHLDYPTDDVFETYNPLQDGDTDSPYDANHFLTLFQQLEQDPEAANMTLMDNFDVLQEFGRGEGPSQATYEGIQDILGDSVAGMLEAGTVGLSDANNDGQLDNTEYAFMGDALAARVFQNTAQHPTLDYTDTYRHALGEVVTSTRYFGDAMYSVTAIPQGGMLGTDGDWYDYDSRAYRDGIELDRDVWAAVHQEVMADPEIAMAVIDQTNQFMQAQTDALTAYPDVRLAATGDDVDAGASSTHRYARDDAHAFLIDNFNAAYEDIQSELQEIADSEEAANGAVGKLIDYASDPTAIPKNLIVDGVKVGVGWLFDQSNDADQEAIQQQLDQMNELRENQLEDLNSNPTQYTDIATNLLTPDGGRIDDVIVTNADGGQTTYTGNPQTYIDQYTTEYPASASTAPYTVDATFIGPDGSLVPVGDMNDAQLQAYEAWLHDPAVQAEIDQAMS